MLITQEKTAGILFALLEVIALICGIAGRRSDAGKFGICFSGMLLLLFGAVATYVHVSGRDNASWPEGSVPFLQQDNTQDLLQQLGKELDEPWVWNDLQIACKAGTLPQKDVNEAVKILIAHITATQPDGLTQPLLWKDGFLGAATKAGMVSPPVLLDLCDAVYGRKPAIRLPRWREGKPDLPIRIEYGSVWAYQTKPFLGVELLWHVERVLLDGKPMKVQLYPMFYGEAWYGSCPGSLKAGNHKFAVDVECAYVDSDKLIGLNGKDLPVDHWPDARKRWKQSVSTDLKVYAADEPMVSLITDPTRSPDRTVEIGSTALSCRPRPRRQEEGYSQG